MRFSLKNSSLLLALLLLIVSLCACGGGGGSVGGPPPPPPPADFSLSVSPTSATVPPGGILPLQVSVAAHNGFNGTVTVDVTNLPAGVTLSPPAPFTMSPGSQTVTLTVALNVTLGNFSVQLNGSSGNLQHSAALALSVQQVQFADFDVNLNDSQLSFPQGGSASTIVGITFLTGGNTNYQVQFSVTGLPNGVQAAFGENPFFAGDPATSLIFTASPNSGLANYANISITATRLADGVQATGQLRINVTPPVGTLPAIRTDLIRTDGAPGAAVYDPAHNVVYASNPLWNRVDVISASTHQIVSSVPAPNPTGMDLSLDGKQLIVGSNMQQIVSIDTTSLQVVKRANVSPIVVGGATYGIPALIANTTNGKALVGMTLNSSPPAYYLEQWDPAAGTFTALSAPGVSAYVNRLVRTGDGSKVMVVDYGSDLNVAIYDAATDSFPVSGPSPVGQVLGVVGSPVARQFAMVGTSGFAFVDSNLHVLGTPPLGGIFWGMTYSPDGKKLYVTNTQFFSECGTNYPVLLTFDTATFSLLGMAPSFETGSGNQCFPYRQTTPLTADPTGLIYSAHSRGVVLDDAANFQNLLTLPVGPPFPSFGFTDEAPLNAPLDTGLGQMAFDVLPDVWFGDARGTNIRFSGPLVDVTAPASATTGMVNVKAVLPDAWFSLTPQVFSYGSKILFLGGTAAAPQGGASLAIIGYGLIGNTNSPVVTIGGQSARVLASSKYIDFNDSGYNITYPFADVDEVLVAVPPGAPGTVDITVTSPAGTTTLPKSFTYLPAVSDYSTADTLSYVLYDPQRHWVYLSAGDHIDVFNADAHQYLSPIVPPTISGVRQMRALALSPDHSKLLAANWSDLSVAVIDPDNPGSAVAVQVIPSGLPNNPGPYTLATTSKNEAFVSTSVCGGAPIYTLNLATLQVTTPSNTPFICGPSSMWSSGSGDYVLMGTALWTAATDQWVTSLPLANNTSAVSQDGHWLASDYTLLDTQLTQHMQSQEPEFFSSLLVFPELRDEKLNASGSILYTPVPQPFGTGQSGGVNVSDTNHGVWLGQILLTEQVQNSPVQSAMDFDEAGNRLFLITDKGLTVVDLAASPLSIGYLNPATGPASGGTTVILRGSGFKSGATVKFGTKAATATFIDGSTLQVTAPSGTVGGTRVSVQNSDGTSYSLDAAFTYQ